MTREEAIAKGAAVQLVGTAAGAPTSYSNRIIAHNFVAIAEALGMLKLEEPKSEPKVMMFEAIRICRSAYNDTDAFVAGLERQGYKIVEK